MKTIYPLTREAQDELSSRARDLQDMRNMAEVEFWAAYEKALEEAYMDGVLAYVPEFKVTIEPKRYGDPKTLSEMRVYMAPVFEVKKH